MRGFEENNQLTVGEVLEALSPEYDTLLQTETDALQEKRVLQTAKVLQVVVGAKSLVQVLHAQWEVLAESINAGCCRCADVADTGCFRVACVRCYKRLAQVVQDGCQPVVLVHPRQEACSELQASLQVPCEFVGHDAHLLPHMHERRAALEQYLSSLNKLRHLFPVYLEPRFFVVAATSRRRLQLIHVHSFLVLAHNFPSHGKTLNEFFAFSRVILLQSQLEKLCLEACEALSEVFGATEGQSQGPVGVVISLALQFHVAAPAHVAAQAKVLVDDGLHVLFGLGGRAVPEVACFELAQNFETGDAPLLELFQGDITSGRDIVEVQTVRVCLLCEGGFGELPFPTVEDIAPFWI